MAVNNLQAICNVVKAEEILVYFVKATRNIARRVQKRKKMVVLSTLLELCMQETIEITMSQF